LHFKIRFDDISGLKVGDGVAFEGNIIGKVEKVYYTPQNDYLVDAFVEDEFTNAVTRDSQFYIANDPRSGASKVIEVIQEKAGGIALSDGDVVLGSVKSTIFDQFIENFQEEVRRNQDQIQTHFNNLKKTWRQSSEDLKGALDDLAQQLAKLSDRIEKVPDSQEVKELQQALTLLAEELKRSQKAIREKIQKELLPMIQERLNKLRESLEPQNRQKEIEPLDRQLKEMRKI
jgi:paraquat-inducible protein B